jgi:hypothetical protein
VSHERSVSLAEEPLLDSILAALRWANGKGGFMVGNIVDPIYAARLKRNEQHSDDDVYRTLDGIRQRCLAPHYEQLENDKTKNGMP